MKHEDVSTQSSKLNQAAPPPPASGHEIRWFLLIPVLLAILAGLTFYLRSHSSVALAETTQGMEAEPVAVTRPQVGKADNDLSLPSTLQAFSDSPVYARASGYVAHWYADIGTPVRKGQLLAVIESPEVDQELNQARATLSQTQANLTLAGITAKRYQGLIDTNAVAQQQVDQNNQNLDAQKAGLQASMANVKRLEELPAVLNDKENPDGYFLHC
jgi:multidrug efflux pump subunit AcrA (membrane-fusion protein)